MRGPRRIPEGAVVLLSAGQATVRVKLSKMGKKALKRVRKVRAQLRISLKDQAGRVTTATKFLTLER